MSDRIPAAIDIGGELPKELVDDFIQAIADNGPSLEWGDKPFEPKTAQDLMEARTDGLLTLKADDARQGCFHSVEAFCAKHGLSYDRQSDAKCDFDGELVQKRPGEKEHIMYCTNTGIPLVAVADIQRLFGAKLEQLRKCPQVRKDKLFELCGLNIRPLPRFTVTG